jgi:small nuclear ribonucleoprotein (snRNP)-like protein
MTSWRQLVAIGVVVSMLHLTLVDVARAGELTALPNSAAVKQQVELFGVGAKVKVRLADGKKLSGTIQGIEDSAFLVASNGSSPAPVAYERVGQLKLAKNTYKAKGPVDAEEARRVVAGLGVGRHIVVKTAAGKEYHGNIQAIKAESFSMLPDHQTMPLQIAYNEAAQLGPNLSTAAKVLIVVAVVVVLASLIAWGAAGAPR